MSAATAGGVLQVLRDFLGPIGDEFGNESGVRYREAIRTVEAMADALTDILHYSGGAESSLDDEYVVGRATQSLAAFNANHPETPNSSFSDTPELRIAETTRCAMCHPETCGCPDYKVMLGDDCVASGGYDYCREVAALLRDYGERCRLASTGSAHPAVVAVAPVIVPDEPDAHRVTLTVGVQQFPVGPEYMDTRDEADDYAGMLRKAMARVSTGSARTRCDDCHEPVGSTAVCRTCADLRCESVADAVRASTGSAPAPSGVPEGFALVPVEPTDEILAYCMGFSDETARRAYAKMLAAAATTEQQP